MSIAMDSTIYKNTFGLDISDGAIRAVKLHKNGKQITIESFGESILPAGWLVNGEIKQPEKVTALIQKLLRQTEGKKISTKNAIAVLPEQKTFIKVVKIAVQPNHNIEELITEAIKNYIPLDREEIYLDWQIIAKSQGIVKVLIGAAPKKIVDAYTSLLEASDLIPHALEIEAAALTRSLLTEKSPQGAKVIIDIGAVRTGLVLYGQGTIQFTMSLPISGNKITETVAKTLNLDLKKAEQAKIICGLDKSKCEGALLTILTLAINQLVVQIKKGIAFYQSNDPAAEPINEVILCGGGANFSEIDRVLAEKLQLPVRIGDPLLHISKRSKVKIEKNKALSYSTAIGLALRAFQKES